MWLHQPVEGREVLGLVREADKDGAGDALTGDRLQAELGLVEAISHLPGEEQPAVQVVAPLMIGAHKPHGGAFVGGAHPASAMAAGVVEGADPTLKIAHHHHRIVADLQCEEASGIWKFAIVSREEPVPAPDQLEVESKEGRVNVKGSRKAEAISTASYQPQHFVSRIHVPSWRAKD
jgi:hypothetical protein